MHGMENISRLFLRVPKMFNQPAIDLSSSLSDMILLKQSKDGLELLLEFLLGGGVER